MDMSLVNKEHRLVCPYNNSHLVDPSRMQIHLQKCKRSYPDIKLVVCPFNATHHVREESLHNHIRSCPNKDIVERDMFYRHNPELANRSKFPFETPQEEEPSQVCVENEEPSWDSDASVNRPSFNPERAMLQRQVPRPIPFGFGKSGKKKFREVDQERLRRLKEKEPIDDLIYPTPGGGSISVSELLRGCDPFAEPLDSQSLPPPSESSLKTSVPNVMKTDRAFRVPVSKHLIESTRNQIKAYNDDESSAFHKSSLMKSNGGRGKGDSRPSYAELSSVSNVFKNL